MALWMVRPGKHGEHERRFFDTGKIYLTWEGLEKTDLSAARDFDAIRQIMRASYPDVPARSLGASTGQVWAFAVAMKPSDWVVVPRKTASALALAEITGEYRFNSSADGVYQHSRDVKWLNLEVPRSIVDQDLLYSLGALMTICEIRRNNAESRIKAMATNGLKTSPSLPRAVSSLSEISEETPVHDRLDLEELARDQIAKIINAKFKGHGLARLVEAVLKAQGYTTFRSPEGPDSGVDILASPGPLGFGQPRICVQVKSSDSPIDSPTLNQLIGTMQNMHADQGLLVSWGGFKSSVNREVPRQFFRVRIWDQRDLLTELFAHYEQFDGLIAMKQASMS